VTTRQRRRHCGRPRKANAKRRATTTAGRAPFLDLGSPELVIRKARVANGSGEAVELVDVVGILNAHDLLDTELTLIARLLASWLRMVQRAFGLPAGSPAGLWAVLTSGQRAGQWAPLANVSGVDRALFRLAEVHEYFGELGRARSVGTGHAGCRGRGMAGDPSCFGRAARGIAGGPGIAAPRARLSPAASARGTERAAKRSGPPGEMTAGWTAMPFVGFLRGDPRRDRRARASCQLRNIVRALGEMC
jgi:hypothetical protein